MQVEIAIIGGSGLYSIAGASVVKTLQVDTPWGEPSAPITVLSIDNIHIAFLPRHGIGHCISPTEVYILNLGCRVIIAFSAVGSLREEIEPTHFALPNQIIDKTKGIRPSSFFTNGVVAHAAFGDPFDNSLINLIANLNLDIKMHVNKTLVCMEGPAFSTRAESILNQQIGVSAIPESKLAREAEIAYVMICMSTDYDSWKSEAEGVDVTQVMSTMKTNSLNACLIVKDIVKAVDASIKNGMESLKKLEGSMKNACCTTKEHRNKDTVEKLNFILPGYF